MARSKKSPAKNSYLFLSEAIIEAETEDEAKEIFAWDHAFYFAENAKCYEVCTKCYPRTQVNECCCK